MRKSGSLDTEVGYASKFDSNSRKFPQKQFLNGQSVTATIMALPSPSTAERLLLLLNSISESETNSSKRAKKSRYKLGSGSGREDELTTEEFNFTTGQHITGYVYKVDKEWVWLTISRNVRAQLFILDSSCDPSELDEFKKRFHVGKIVTGHVLTVNKDEKLLRLVVAACSTTCSFHLWLHHGWQSIQNTSRRTPTKFVEKIEDLYPNTMGYIKNVTPKGCFIFLSRKLDAKILLSNLSDGYVKDHEKEFPIGKLDGLCHKSELSDDHIDIKTEYRAGERARAKILKREIIAAEKRLLEKDVPRTTEEFEKLYMAFAFSIADVEKARSIAERALQIINIREESEKLNIWVAYFNLENEYGNPPDVWLRQIQWFLNQQKDRVVQSIVNRALLSLPKHKHTILELKCGEIRLGDIDVIRALFERATCLSLPAKKMKFLFKKYLEYEKSLDDEERNEYIKKTAMDYVESTLA
ncbi:hypothetical protein TIFTF001_036343 [Ficus carica]|uniref:S1 motif domain-containing protein n=1 Tax=Ficus carica TaxID=3494 RepID=A0AA88JB04_FICCA|nr:hypothetical protein TIFTF001_036343 [Ficus carica]